MNYKYLILFVLIGCGKVHPHNQKPPDTVESLREELQQKENEIESLKLDVRNLNQEVLDERNYYSLLFKQYMACRDSHDSLVGLAADFVPSVTQDENALYPIAKGKALTTANFIFENINYQEIRDYLDHLIDPDKALPSKEED